MKDGPEQNQSRRTALENLIGCLAGEDQSDLTLPERVARDECAEQVRELMSRPLPAPSEIKGDDVSGNTLPRILVYSPQELLEQFPGELYAKLGWPEEGPETIPLSWESADPRFLVMAMMSERLHRGESFGSGDFHQQWIDDSLRQVTSRMGQ